MADSEAILPRQGDDEVSSYHALSCAGAAHDQDNGSSILRGSVSHKAANIVEGDSLFIEQRPHRRSRKRFRDTLDQLARRAVPAC